jgi:hypothetical protein
MTEHYSEANRDDEDLSGFLVSQPRQIKQKTSNHSEAVYLSQDNDDLSGFLTSQSRHKPTKATVNLVVPIQADDDDLSGCLAAVSSQPKQQRSPDPIVPPTDRSKIEAAIADDNPSSDWFYFH